MKLMWNELVRSSESIYRTKLLFHLSRELHTIYGAFYISIWSVICPIFYLLFIFLIWNLLSLFKSLFSYCWSNERPYYMISVYQAPNNKYIWTKMKYHDILNLATILKLIFLTKLAFACPQNDFSFQFRYEIQFPFIHSISVLLTFIPLI